VSLIRPCIFVISGGAVCQVIIFALC
jgi:hypothetical protein